MQDLLKNFFELEDFLQQTLFAEKNAEKKLFSALINLPEFLKTLPLGQINSKIPDGTFLINPETIFIDKNVQIDSGCLIQGPCYISQDCAIRHGAFLRGPVFLSRGCVVGHATEVKNAVFLKQASAAHFAYVGDSILGKRVNLGAGVKCANLKLDKTPITVHIENRKIQTGLTKLGAILGDHVQVGCNSVLNPGTFAAKAAFIYPSLSVGGYIPSCAVVKPSAGFKIIIRKNKQKLFSAKNRPEKLLKLKCQN